MCQNKFFNRFFLYFLFVFGNIYFIFLFTLHLIFIFSSIYCTFSTNKTPCKETYDSLFTGYMNLKLIIFCNAL